MNKITLNRDFYTTTETSRAYVDHSKSGRVTPCRRVTAANELIEADLLIRNKYNNTLSVDDAANQCDPEPEPEEEEQPTGRRCILPLPKTTGHQEYTDRIAQCYPRMANGDLSTEHIAKMLRDRNRTVYLQDYCMAGSGIVSKRTQKRAAERNGRLPAGWQIDTTYQASYRSAKDIAEIGEIPQSRSCKPVDGVDDQLNAKLRQLFKMGKSEYTARLGDEANLSLELGRYGAHRRQGYLDRYTKESE